MVVRDGARVRARVLGEHREGPLDLISNIRKNFQLFGQYLALLVLSYGYKIRFVMNIYIMNNIMNTNTTPTITVNNIVITDRPSGDAFRGFIWTCQCSLGRGG